MTLSHEVQMAKPKQVADYPYLMPRQDLMPSQYSASHITKLISLLIQSYMIKSLLTIGSLNSSLRQDLAIKI